MCRGHIYVRMCPYTRVCYPHTRIHTYTNFARVYVPCFHMLVQFVFVRVCVFPSEMECVLFYSRKIAHRANVICCIMYPTLNKFYLILSYHQMETFSAVLAICAGSLPVPGEFPAQRPVMRSFDVFFDLRLNKRLRKQSWGWWFETLSPHYYVIVMHHRKRGEKRSSDKWQVHLK